jgi:hypothetical protein
MNDVMLRTLFLQAPSFDGFDGGAGARYQAKREIRSFWYPTWLAQPAALVPGSRLLDAPADGLTVDATLAIAQDHELVIIHTSTPSFPGDVRFAEMLKARNPHALIGMVGARVAVDAEGALRASRALDFVAREEFDYTCRDIAAGMALEDVAGISWRDGADGIHHNPARATIENMDDLPFVAPVYRRDLHIDNYFIGYLLYPYVSLYTALHVLPVAADGRRTSLPHALGGKRAGRSPLDQGEHARSQGDHVRRRHVHRRPSARRIHRARAGCPRRHMVVQCQGQRALFDAEGHEGKWLAAATGRL